MSAPQPKRRHQHYAPPAVDNSLDLFAQASRRMFAFDNQLSPYGQVGAPTYSGDLDGERLTSQLDAVLALMQDGTWRTLSEIRAAIGRGSEAGISARLREIRASRRGQVERRRRGDPKQGLWEYRLVSLCK